jgi:ankyrin repeat protein
VTIRTLATAATAVLLATASARAADTAMPVVAAARASDLAAVRLRIGEHADVNAPEADGTTALHWAVQQSNRPMIDLLLGAGANPNAANRYGVTPLHLAAVNADAAVITALLDHHGDPNVARPGGETPLMTAARSGDVATLKALLAHGASVMARESWKGQTALMWAAADNHSDAIKVLLAAGASLNERSKAGEFSAFLFAVRGGHIDAARALLDAGADVNETLPDGTSAVTLAVMNAHYQLAAVLLAYGGDPNAAAQGWTPLHQLAWTRRPNYGYNLPGPVATGTLDALELVSMLVQYGADVNARETKEPRDGNRNMLNRIGATPFLLAAKAVDLPLMKTLVAAGADAGLPNVDGTTPLMVAAGVGIWAPGESPGTEEEAMAAVRFLLDLHAGAVTDVDANGNTAAHGAVLRGGSLPILRLLVERGARLDVKNKRGWTPLTIADGVEYTPDIFKRYPETAAAIRQMISARADDPRGQTRQSP